MSGAAAAVRNFASKLRRLPKELAEQAAIKAAPAITALALQSFDAQESPDGTPWKPGVDGRPVTLRKTGRMEGNLSYVAIGPKLRVRLGVRYAKYLIGARPIFPKRGQLPDDYVDEIRTAVEDAGAAALE